MAYIRENNKEEAKRQDVALAESRRSHRAFFDFLGNQIELSSNDEILDVGCGSGAFSFELASRFSCRVTGWDISESLIEAAVNRKISERAGKVTFKVARFFDNVNVSDAGRFSAVVFRQAIMECPRQVELLSWAKHLVRPGGVIAALEPDYGATVLFPEPKLWKKFFEDYRKFAIEHDEDFNCGRKLLHYFQSSDLLDVDLQPIIETYTASEAKALQRFLEGEIFSIRQDIPNYSKNALLGSSDIATVLDELLAIGSHSGGYIQTQMMAVCGRKA